MRLRRRSGRAGAGGVVMGHVLTEALNEPEQEKTNDARYI